MIASPLVKGWSYYAVMLHFSYKLFARSSQHKVKAVQAVITKLYLVAFLYSNQRQYLSFGDYSQNDMVKKKTTDLLKLLYYILQSLKVDFQVIKQIN